LVRIDVTVDSATTEIGLQEGETITASVIGVPTAAGKTLIANGGSLVDTSTAAGSSGRSDLGMAEVKIGTPASVQGTVGSTTSSTSANTDWRKIVNHYHATLATPSNVESFTGLAAGVGYGTAFDGQLGGYGTAGTSSNTYYTNMDGRKESTATNNTVSYYVSIFPRSGATVLDQGAYTVQFQLTDAAGVVRGTKTVKIDFVTTAAKSDATVAIATSGTFLAGAALGTSDSTGATYATVTLRNRDGGLVRANDGSTPTISAKMQESTTSVPVYTDTNTAGSTRLNLSDTGTLGADFGTSSQGVGTLVSYDGVYGVEATNLPFLKSETGQAYRIEAGYGNAPIQTAAITIFPASGSGTASANYTDVLVTAAGMSATDQAVNTDVDATDTWTLPTTTTSATLKFWIKTSGETATPGALITATPTWTGTVGTSQISPATSTTGTVYTTDALGNFSVTVTNSAPVHGATLSLALSGGAAFGAAKYTAVLTWATPVASSIAIADPISGIHVLAGSTNVTTVIVKDQFGNPVKDQVVTVSTSQSPAVVSTTVISPITTNAAGTATYSFTPAAAATSGTVSFNTAPTAQATAASRTYTYVATLPVVATLTGYFDRTWGTAAATLVPATGIYSAAGTALVLDDARNISKPLTNAMDTSASNDEITLAFTGLTAAGVSATGASVTVTAGTGGWILDASDLPVKSRTFAVTATGTDAIRVMATGTGAITFTATSGTVTATASMWVAGRLAADNSNKAGRFITVTSAKTGAANGSGVPVTVAVTDRYGNPVSGVDLNVVASGVGSFMGGNITQSFRTDASGSYTFLANTTLSDGGVAKFTATTGTVGSFDSIAGYVGTTEVDSTLAAGNASASAEITFAAGASATDVAQAATDAAAEATDAANAATDAANAAAEAADAATAAAQDAADAVAALSTQVAELVSTLRKQITSLTNLVIKIQKKVKA
jgi:hypothetical protein